MMIKRLITLYAAMVIIALITIDNLNGQSFFSPADSLDKTRFYTALGVSTTAYTGFSIGLYHAWYKQYPQSRFHFFDDGGEWNNMDKAGHIYTAYFQGTLCYQGAKWTGLSEKQSILTGIICGSLFQTTIEVMDGFSDEWGFSLYDFGANAIGVSFFAWQQSVWKEQRIRFKESYTPVTYAGSFQDNNGNPVGLLEDRANDLFGSSFAEKYLKDYNGQTYWMSINLKSFNQDLPVPKWFNIALGYGSENLFGGHENKWEEEGNLFMVDKTNFPRYRQFYLSLDVDLDRLNVKSPFLKTVLSILNISKVPAPALEYNTNGEWVFHFLKF